MPTSNLKILKSESEIQKRISEMGKLLTEKFKGKTPIVICVLNSSFMFYSDLIRHIELEMRCEFMAVSSYKDSKVSSGEIQVTMDLDYPLEGQDVVLVEDMLDTGLTMNFLIRYIKTRNPASLTTVVLLDKAVARKTECSVDFVGFEVGNEFIVGYGIDYSGQYRNVPYLAIHT